MNDNKSSSFTEKFPEVAAQWHPTLNGDKLPVDFTFGSKKVVWWQGDCGHEWDANILSRTRQKQGCPYCSGNRILVGFNDLATINPQVSSWWDYEKNGDLTPQDVTVRSGKRVYWVCPQGHNMSLIISEMTRTGRMGCAYCSGRKILPGNNDLLTLYPELAVECVNAEDRHLSPGSGVQIEWRCSKREKHSYWRSTVKDRVRGSDCPSCSGRRVVVGETDLASRASHLLAEWNDEKVPTEFSYGSHYRAQWKCENGHYWRASIHSRVITGNRCPICAGSAGEREVYDYIVSLMGDASLVKHHCRTLINPQEVDIYIPSKKIAIEFNGLYWHSEHKLSNRKYHYDKWRACQDQGVQLIQIWEDEWSNNPVIIKNMLAAKLGASSHERVSGRNTKIKDVALGEASDFLNKHHIQGSVAGSYRIGLVEKKTDELVAVLIAKWDGRKGTETERSLVILRYATSKNVRGGFTKLLTFLERNTLASKFLTFSDNCISDGGLYENNGFEVTAELSPDYRYVVGKERKHKFGYRLKRFHTDPELLWEEGLSERELALLNGIPRIWDAGKIRWEKPVSK